MKKIFLLPCLVVTFLLISSLSVATPSNNQASSIAPMLKKNMPAVVNIISRGKLKVFSDPFLKKELEHLRPDEVEKLGKEQFIKSGSGVILNASKGIIVTNAHVVDQAQTIIVNLKDGRKYIAHVIGKDGAVDLAVLQIKAKNLTALPFGDSANLKVGDFVAAIGNPFGLQQTVTSGIISGLHRSNLKIEGFENFIQTDAPINEGNSGGALINHNGKLIGINTAILSKDGGNLGIGFAIPSNMVKSIVNQILTYGKTHRGILGVVVQTLNPQLAKALGAPHRSGAVVTQVMPFSPAAIVGLKVGDIILSVNGQAVKTNDDVKNIVGLLRIGDKLEINITRNGKQLTLRSKVGDPKTSGIKQRLAHPFLYGLKLENTAEQSAETQKINGVKILKVEPNTLPWTMGLVKGDIIVSANRQPVADIKKLDEIASASNTGLLLRVYHNERFFFILLQ